MKILYVICVAFVWLSSVIAQASTVIDDLEPQTLVPGDVLDVEVRFQRVAGKRLELRLPDPPPGATLVPSDGNLYLQWESGPGMDADTEIRIEVRDFDTQQVLDTATVLVRMAAAEEQSPDEISVPGASDQPIIRLMPVHSQIVSVGKAISVLVEGVSSDGELPVITIDRVPPNASFERNEQDQYLFYWLTTGRNQGEHTFLVTAEHPYLDANTVQDEFTVYIGDPSLGNTKPAESAVSE
jgi:hypothetical protein